MKLLLGGAALVVAIVIAGSAPAAAAPPCASEASCRRACDTHGGRACRELGRMLAEGDGVAPDRAKAVAAWTKGCDGVAGAASRDARSCRELSSLLHDGWTLEVAAEPFRAADRLYQAIDLGNAACTGGDADGCATVALAIRDDLDRAGWPSAMADRAGELVATARRACEAGALDGCWLLRSVLWTLVGGGLITEEVQVTAREAADKALAAACRRGDAAACLDGGDRAFADDKGRKAALAALATACDGGDARACLARVMILAMQIDDPEDQLGQVQMLVTGLVKACHATAHELCAEVALGMIDPDGELAQLGVADAATGMKLLRYQCDRGNVEACEVAGEVLREGSFGVAKDDRDARTLLDRACRLSPSRLSPYGGASCAVCDRVPDLPECKLRLTWQVSVECQKGNLGACEDLGDRYRAGDGVAASATDAARSYKYACDASIKGACGKLDEVCRASDGIGDELCAPSLLHTDVFYEAEWQLRVNQKATLSKGNGAAPDPAAVKVGLDAPGGPGVTMARGSLDADLVVSVVLDRAREAAIRLVADELRDKVGQRGLRTYMRDLLAQGASLLADTTSLRRDALHDLGMTLVRAFAASNLVRTLLADPGAARRAPVIGPIVAEWKPEWLQTRAGRLAPDVEAYLADLAYWALGSGSLFARIGAVEEPPPACPFRDGRKALCEGLTTRTQVAAALRIDGILTALNMVRALHAEGGIDVRRLIEAIAQSTSIVDFASTPGLNIDAWQARIVDELRRRVTVLRTSLADLTRLITPSTYADGGPDVLTLARQAAAAREFLVTGDGRALLGAELALELTGVLAISTYAQQGLAGAPTPEQLAAARQDARAAADKLGSAWRAALLGRLKPVHDKIDELARVVDELGRHILTIRTSLEHHQGLGAAGRLAIDELPLGDLDELIVVVPKVVGALDALDGAARELFPSVDLRGLRFARSSCVRLLGFLDLMSRVARSVRLTQTVREVIDTLELLGRWQAGEFSAPLFDMLAPVVAMIETRKPMPLEQLFAIVGRVRLDSLVTSLISDEPCAEEDRAECWVFKIAYSLQEAITRDGDSIRIDGAEVAKRLARFGDDFQRRNKGRWYFHLSVGVGSLWSPPPEDAAMPGAGDGLRFTPLIAEQVGFGWATPAVWHDRLTFKAGLAASGILYRVLLDNEESNAVMGSAFVAVDVYDLVEVWGAATLLAYPPLDGADARVEPGVSVGLSVPLSAYLERL